MNTNAAALTSRFFDGHLVRFVLRADGLWFVGVDVCDALDIKNSRDSIAKMVPARHVSNVVGSDVRNGPNRGLQVISEPGLYRLLTRSRKPAAEPFMDWLTEDVLPAIRKQGFYAANGVDPQVARIEQGRILLQRARLLSLEAAGFRRQASLLLLLEDGMTIAEALPGAGTEERLRGARRAVAFARRNNIPIGRDANGRMQLPRGAMRTALGLDQGTLDLAN